MNNNWDPSSWRAKDIAQSITWNESTVPAEEKLSELPPLVFAQESDHLKNSLAQVQEGKGFVLQMGDCAESFGNYKANTIKNQLKLMLQMSAILTFHLGMPITKIGRIAGQFAKPRSELTEIKEGVELPSFRGHIVNDVDFSKNARQGNPERLIEAYHQSAGTLNLLRAFVQGGFANLNDVHSWNRQFIQGSKLGDAYNELADEISRALRFLEAAGVNNHPAFHQVDYWTSHEALILEYEQALCRKDSRTNNWYGCSSHMLWLGERTRQQNGAHLEFLQGVENPIGVKLGPTASPEEAKCIKDILNPEGETGKLSFITRMGKDIDSVLPALMREVGDEVIWICDPMHGNTYNHNGQKTRHFDDILREIESFISVASAEGINPGGIHLEVTGEDVTECLGGSYSNGNLDNYQSLCDPRLNVSQSLELAFKLTKILS